MKAYHILGCKLNIEKPNGCELKTVLNIEKDDQGNLHQIQTKTNSAEHF